MTRNGYVIEVVPVGSLRSTALIEEWITNNLFEYDITWRYWDLSGGVINSIWFRDEEDALAFKIRFGL